jgi:sugar phosphate permease
MDENLSRKVQSFRWAIFAVLGLAYFFVYFHRLSLSVVADDLARDFETTAGVLGLLGSVYFYCYAAMQFPAGLLSDSVGPRKTVTFSLVLAAAGSLLFGLAPGLTTAFIGRIMVGLGVSLVFIPAMKILSQWFRAREFAVMAGILNAVGGMGVLAGTWLLGVLATCLGWRISFELIGGCTVVILVLVWLIVRDRPTDKGWPSIVEQDRSTHETPSAPEKIGLWAGARKVVSEKRFWPVAVWFFFDCGIFFGFGGLWSGPYLMHVYGMSRGQAGAVLSMIAWGMIVGSPFLGLLSERVLRSRKQTFVSAAIMLVVLFGIVNVFPVGLPRLVLFVWFFLFSVCSSAIVIMGFTSTKELFPVEIAGTSVGTVNLFPFLGGAVFMPLLGRVLDRYALAEGDAYGVDGYVMVLRILLVASVCVLACTFIMKETYRRPIAATEDRPVCE